MLALVWRSPRCGVPPRRHRPFAVAQRGAVVFRLAGLAVVLLLLLQPSRLEQVPPPVANRVTLMALDTSLSMKQRDVNGVMRLDAARNLLVDAEALTAPACRRRRVSGCSRSTTRRARCRDRFWT